MYQIKTHHSIVTPFLCQQAVLLMYWQVKHETAARGPRAFTINELTPWCQMNRFASKAQ